ncbi:zinc finger protein 467 isoform X2 [Trichomycterus rosablanca]|uniref:zinc finger protein 467 isoform X2 n=1 Tax=Trichomycterus rosablanca TaxID=2290929 RepID=UPI002F359ADA
MSETLLLSFQSQLSGVMENLLRSVLLEITRLVESSFLEEVGRGKQEADVLRRRLQILETKLSERERVRRVKCADCGRTGLSKKVTGGRESRTQAEVVCVTKQECVSEAGRRNCEKRTVTPGQEATTTIPDSEPKTAEVSAAIEVEGAMKEEMTGTPEVQIYSAPCQTADHRVSQGHSVGQSTLHPDHRLPQRDKPTGNQSCASAGQDSVKQRMHLNNSESKTEHPVHPSAPSLASPTRNQVPNGPDSVPVKQEVVVVLPPEWGEPERVRSGTVPVPSRVNQAPEELQRRDPVPTGPSEDRRVVYPGSCAKQTPSSQITAVKKKPKPQTMPVSGPVAQGHPYRKSPPLPKPAQAPQQFPRPCADERTPQALGFRTHGHIGGHHAARMPRICSHCGKAFAQLSHLKAHQQIHTGERQFCCNLCGRSFTKLSNLKAHRRVHTGERPYICMHCGKRFTQKCNLKRHQRIHSAHT